MDLKEKLIQQTREAMEAKYKPPPVTEPVAEPEPTVPRPEVGKVTYVGMEKGITVPITEPVTEPVVGAREAEIETLRRGYVPPTTPPKKPIATYTTTEASQLAWEEMKQTETALSSLQLQKEGIKPELMYRYTDPETGEVSKVRGSRVIEKLDTRIEKAQEYYLSTQKQWQYFTGVEREAAPETRIVETEKGLTVEYPYVGAEKYRYYKEKLRDPFLGLATAFTPTDPLGLTSAYYMATGEPEKALATKITSLEYFKQRLDEGLAGFGKYWFESPITQVGFAASLGVGVAGVAKAFPTFGRGAMIAGVGLGAVQTGALISEVQAGRVGEAFGKAGMFGFQIAAAGAGAYRIMRPPAVGKFYKYMPSSVKRLRFKIDTGVKSLRFKIAKTTGRRLYGAREISEPYPHYKGYWHWKETAITGYKPIPRPRGKFLYEPKTGKAIKLATGREFKAVAPKVKKLKVPVKELVARDQPKVFVEKGKFYFDPVTGKSYRVPTIAKDIKIGKVSVRPKVKLKEPKTVDPFAKKPYIKYGTWDRPLWGVQKYQPMKNIFKSFKEAIETAPTPKAPRGVLVTVGKPKPVYAPTIKAVAVTPTPAAGAMFRVGGWAIATGGLSLAQLEFLEEGTQVIHPRWGRKAFDKPSIIQVEKQMRDRLTAIVPVKELYKAGVSEIDRSQKRFEDSMKRVEQIRGLQPVSVSATGLAQLQQQAQAQRQVQVQAQMLKTELQQEQMKETVYETPFLSETIKITPTKLGLGLPEFSLGRRKGEEEKLQAYNVLVKDRYIVKGKKRYEERFVTLNKKPLSKFDAMSFGGTVTDNSAAASFKIIRAKGKPQKPSIYSTSWHWLKNQFYTKKDIFIEKTTYRINTVGEIKEISARGWVAEKRKAVKPVVSMKKPRVRRKKYPSKALPSKSLEIEMKKIMRSFSI